MHANNSSRSAAAPRRYPLHVHIATVAIALIVVAGGVIGWFNYSQHARLVLAAADRVFDRLHRELVADLEQGSQRNYTTVEMLARTRVGAAASREYAERYLLPEQIDEVDVARYVAAAGVQTTIALRNAM